MATLQCVRIDTSFNASQTAVQSDPQNSDNNRLTDDRPPDDCDEDDESIADLGDSVDVIPNEGEPYFFYDCETTGGSYRHDHII